MKVFLIQSLCAEDLLTLRQVYVNAIEDYVPPDMIRAIVAYLDFCFIARRAELLESDLNDLDEALAQFHLFQKVFQAHGVRAVGPEGLSLPRQHAMKHYRELIEWFGAPNGLCTSITEAKHIKCVKEPWRRSNRFRALGQMLLTNQRTDKMAAFRNDLQQRGMLSESVITWATHLHLLLDNSINTNPQSMSTEAVTPDPLDNTLQVPNDPDGGPIHTHDITHRVSLARTPRKFTFWLSLIL